MNYGSVCSGIEAATVAWEPLGWKPQFFSEIEPFPSKVLAYHYPDVPNLGDMCKLIENETFQNATIDLLVGGTPCQSFSIAGLRKGLDDERGQLSGEFVKLLIAKRPAWFLWENVPGCLSDQNGASFASLLTAWTGRQIPAQKWGKAGIIEGNFYSIAWRVFDSQYFGVPQQRRRVFVVGHIGNNWRPPVAVLFERENMRGNTKTGKKKGISNTGTITDGPKVNRFKSFGEYENSNIASTLKKSFTEPATDIIVYLNRSQSDELKTYKNISPTITKFMGAGGGNLPIYNRLAHTQSNGIPFKNDISGSLTKCDVNAVYDNDFPRYFTELECERLQGFPDGYTKIPGAKKMARYEVLGNSMTTFVMRWIGERIDKVDKLLKEIGNERNKSVETDSDSVI